ncbi:hypothetical protein FQN57_001445 [Myotisia sp. PD_48]|nr:hypothetical protein FQN57_001445 [Myotisia sp. PD_48]
MDNAISWSGQFTVTPLARSQKLSGDKIALPPSALEQILSVAQNTSTISRPSSAPFNPFSPSPTSNPAFAAVEQQRELPHPLTFRLVNPENGRVIHSGIREFSSEEHEVSLSPLLLQSLGIEESHFTVGGKPLATTDVLHDDEMRNEKSINTSSLIDQDISPRITVHAIQLPKGTYVRLRPLEAGYDAEDWKALLERHMRNNFTTLTVGEVLSVPVGRKQVFQFLADKVLPEGDAICIVDTDLEVDIEPLDEDQARESLRQRLAKNSRPTDSAGQSSLGGKVKEGQAITAQVIPGEYVDYEMESWLKDRVLTLQLAVEDDDDDIDIFVSPFSARQRARPRRDQHVWGDFTSEYPKNISINPTNVELCEAESLFISIYAPIVELDEKAQNGAQPRDSTLPLKFILVVNTLPETTDQLNLTHNQAGEHDGNEERCKNCHQWVPSRTLVLHENFCLRNNVLCPKCQKVFQKRSTEWENHWHCPQDEAYGNTSLSRRKHDQNFHSNHICHDCGYTASNLSDLAQHRTSVCPEKLILCRFCHLVVPQKGDSDPDVLDPEVILSRLTPHELIDGERTTECHICDKIVRLRDMNVHLRHHELERVSRPPPKICINPNCTRVLDGPGQAHGYGSSTNDTLGLCKGCFGPLYVDTYDPTGKSLRRRIERRYLTQMLKGCGKPWCRNEYCKTGRANIGIGSESGLTTKDIGPLIKPLVDGVSVGSNMFNTTPLYFCTDETSQQRRKLAEMLAAENADPASRGVTYELAWCIAGIEATGGDILHARDWLQRQAPRKGETFQSP